MHQSPVAFDLAGIVAFGSSGDEVCHRVRGRPRPHEIGDPRLGVAEHGIAQERARQAPAVAAGGEQALQHIGLAPVQELDSAGGRSCLEID